MGIRRCESDVLEPSEARESGQGDDKKNREDTTMVTGMIGHDDGLNSSEPKRK